MHMPLPDLSFVLLLYCTNILSMTPPDLHDIARAHPVT